MEIFLNEQSLHSQFIEMREVVGAIENMNRILFRMVEGRFSKQVLFDPSLYYRGTLQTRVFSSCLEQLPDKEVRLQFKRLLYEHFSAKSWRDDSVQEDCEYQFRGEDVRGTSLAELAHRRNSGVDGILLSFTSPIFSGVLQLEVGNDHIGQILLYSISNEDHFEQWAALFPGLGLNRYDPGCGRTPNDSETVLCDRSRFSKTKFKNQGRVVYLDRRTNLYFCVDNLHEFGAHLEVFDANGTHIGEASLDGVVDTSRADGTKYLEL